MPAQQHARSTYLCYWSIDTVNREREGGPIDHIAGDQLSKVAAGDHVWLVTFEGHRLWLVGQIDVGQAMIAADAAALLGSDDLWESEYHLIAAPGTEESMKRIDITELARDLRFDSPTDRLPAKFDQQNFRTTRKLLSQSDSLLADAWGRESAPMDKTNGPTPPDLVPGRVYDRRKEIHGYFGGQMQGGISTPKNHPVVLLFTGEEGHDYGYRDGFREDGIFDYTGEGQTGDMMMKSGNRAIRDHDADRKQLLLFQSAGPGKVCFLGQCHYLGHRHEPALDKDKKPRRAIVFELEIEARHGSGASRDLVVDTDEPESPDLWKLSLDRLRRRALSQAKAGAPAKERKVLLRQRSEAVRVYALRRAGGVCEGCGEDAPFLTPAGRGYLEVHHIQRLADSGPDDPSAVVAICPNCHRRVHHGADGAEYNAFLSGKASAIEASLS